MGGTKKGGLQFFAAYEIDLIGRFIRSSIGRKVIMAISGSGLFLFAVGHMVGNLQIFLGQEHINHYAHMLQSTPELLWPVRIGLVTFAILHVITGLSLWWENRQARAEQYAVKKVVGASWASRTMLVTGTIFLAYVVYHLLHFTVGSVQPEFMTWRDAQGRHDVYTMIVAGFSDYRVAIGYIIGTGAVCFHLSHGASAMFQSLGLKNPAYADRITNLSRGFALVLFLGYAAVPSAVLFGILKQP
jgi:succinate dehydrogenase / fumarate reductase cytochrome b subunit